LARAKKESTEYTKSYMIIYDKTNEKNQAHGVAASFMDPDMVKDIQAGMHYYNGIAYMYSYLSNSREIKITRIDPMPSYKIKSN